MRKPIPQLINLRQEQFLLNHLRQEWQETEKAAKKHERAEQVKTTARTLGEILLKTLFAGGVLTTALVAPNILVVLDGLSRRRFYAKKEQLGKKLREQSSRKCLSYKRTGEGTYRIELTQKGKHTAVRYALQNFTLQRKQSWDGRWRLITFDIPRKQNKARDAIRHKLVEIGMARIQDSVFVYPYSCTEEVLFWAELCGLQDGMIHICVADFLTPLSDELCRRFSLPPK